MKESFFVLLFTILAVLMLPIFLLGSASLIITNACAYFIKGFINLTGKVF